MGNVILKDLLKEYEKKRLQAQLTLDNKIENFYAKNPVLSKINDNINKTSIEISKTILLDKNSEKLGLLQKNLEDLKIEKQNMLNKLNISSDFFVPNFECKLCKDTGYLENNKMCSCLKQKLLNYEYNKSNISSLEFENFDNFSIFTNSVLCIYYFVSITTYYVY